MDFTIFFEVLGSIGIVGVILYVFVKFFEKICP